MEILLCISIALAAGLAMSRLMKVLGLPAVTGYLISGILVGPFCLGALGVNGLGFISLGAVEELGIISDVALGFIAFAIGNEFRLEQLKKVGKQATIVGIAQALVGNPPIIIFDEPTVGLDIMAVEELKKMMREYANHGNTVFITSHNIELVAKRRQEVLKFYEILGFRQSSNVGLYGNPYRLQLAEDKIESLAMKYGGI